VDRTLYVVSVAWLVGAAAPLEGATAQQVVKEAAVDDPSLATVEIS